MYIETENNKWECKDWIPGDPNQSVFFLPFFFSRHPNQRIWTSKRCNKLLLFLLYTTPPNFRVKHTHIRCYHQNLSYVAAQFLSYHITKFPPGAWKKKGALSHMVMTPPNITFLTVHLISRESRGHNPTKNHISGSYISSIIKCHIF